MFTILPTLRRTGLALAVSAAAVLRDPKVMSSYLGEVADA